MKTFSYYMPDNEQVEFRQKLNDSPNNALLSLWNTMEDGPYVWAKKHGEVYCLRFEGAKLITSVNVMENGQEHPGCDCCDYYMANPQVLSFLEGVTISSIVPQAVDISNPVSQGIDLRWNNIEIVPQETDLRWNTSD